MSQRSVTGNHRNVTEKCHRNVLEIVIEVSQRGVTGSHRSVTHCTMLSEVIVVRL